MGGLISMHFLSSVFFLFFFSPGVINCRYLHIAGPDSGSSGARRGSAPVVNASALRGHVLANRRGSEPSLLPVLGAYSWRRRGSEPLTGLNHQHALQRPTTDIAEEEEHAVLEAGSISHQQGNLSLESVCTMCFSEFPECSSALMENVCVFVLQRRGCSNRKVMTWVPIIYLAMLQMKL